MLLVLGIAALSTAMPDPSYRESLIRKERSQQTGGRMVLSEAELQFNALLDKLKRQEMESEDFPPAMHFFQAKDLIEQSQLFSLLQKMPKGGALHVHDFAMVDVDWLVKNVTYRPHCYVCFTDTSSVRFTFSLRQPKSSPPCSQWMLLDNLRAKVGNTTDFDQSLMRNLTLYSDDPEVAYPNQDVVWKRFEEAFLAVWGLVTHAPVFKDYFYEGLKQFNADNVMYLELRALLPQTYELDGTVNSRFWTMKAYQDELKDFLGKHQDFFGCRVIVTAHRGINATELTNALEDAIELQKDFPELMAGFDLVGREDSGRPLWYFSKALSLPAERGVSMPYFFHAGETDFQGTEVDQNMLDALLLNTSRIGHGFALVHHPTAKALSRQMGVAVEVCPISNQVLKLVSDLRNHPAAVLMSEGHPLVVSSDDPALFGACGLSYDFYEAFVGIAGLKADVGTLKEFAVNSIKYSSLSPEQKNKALAIWQKKWERFVLENLPQ